MKTEIRIAAKHIASYFPVEEQAHVTQEAIAVLADRLKSQWYKLTPERGQASRAVTNFNKPCPVLLRILGSAGTSSHTLPAEFCIFIDPGNVSVRVGDTGYLQTLYPLAEAMPVQEYVAPVRAKRAAKIRQPKHYQLQETLAVA